MADDTATWEIVGVNELLANLQTLKDTPHSKPGRAAMRAAALVIKEKLIANAKVLDDPETPNKIYENVDVRFNGRLFKRTGDLGFRVGFLGGAKYRGLNPGKKGPGGDTWYWRLLEFGTKDTAAHPFVRPALANNTQEATEAFIRRFQRAIVAAKRRERRKAIADVRRRLYGGSIS